MHSDKKSGKKGFPAKHIAPAILSAAFLAACGALIYSSYQLEDNINNLNDKVTKQDESLKKIEEGIKEYGRNALDMSCRKAFNTAIKNGHIPPPVTEQSLLNARVSIDIPYNEEMPLPKMIEWVESHGPEYKVTDGKMDCSYLLLRKESPAP